MILTIEDAQRFTAMTVKVDEAYADQITKEEDIFDPYVVSYIYKATGKWPTFGVTVSGWDFCSCAASGDRISAIELAIDSGRVSKLLPILDALPLKDDKGLREQASNLAKRLLNGIGVLDSAVRIQLQGMMMLISKGGIEEGDFRFYEDKAVWYTPNRQYSNGVGKSFFLGTDDASGLSVDTSKQASFPAALLLSDIRDDAFRDEALMNILGSDKIRALEYRERGLEGATLAHLCIRAGLEDTLQKMIDTLDSRIMDIPDERGRTLEDYATELNNTRCQHVLSSCRSKDLTLSILAEIMESASKQ